jgi:hypothetical protein
MSKRKADRPKRVKNRAQLEAALKEQVRFLRKSCTGYDDGDVSEAKRIALHLRILLHDTGMSKSVLGHFGKSFSWRLADTSHADVPGNLAPYHGLLSIKLDGSEGMLVPRFEAQEGKLWPFTPFYSWWNGTIMRDDLGNQFSRKDLVLNVADTDGGAHVDADIDQAYAALSEEGSLGWQTGGGELLKQNPVAPCLRAIAFEVVKTLEAAELIERV